MGMIQQTILSSTVQGRDTPVPASGGGQAGSRSSSSSNCSTMQVDHLASMVSKAPSEKKKQESLKKAPSSYEELLERKATVWERHKKLTADLLKHLVGRRNVSAETNTLAKSISESFRKMRQLDELLSAGGMAQVGQTTSLRTDGTARTSPSLYRMDSESTTRKSKATEDQEEKRAPMPKSRKNRKKRKVRTPASEEA
ncbi:unnamed protein product [Lasius platythorax]|uniref:Uncharacterized protein n=1 Tax=Lasius platythorax TaxID=488582 RepID=A0AAV2MX86_9HYME